MVLFFTACQRERGSIGKLEGYRMDLSSLYFFSIEAMKRKPNFSSPIKTKASLRGQMLCLSLNADGLLTSP